MMAVTTRASLVAGNIALPNTLDVSTTVTVLAVDEWVKQNINCPMNSAINGRKTVFISLSDFNETIVLQRNYIE